MNHKADDSALERDSHRNETNSELQAKFKRCGISKTYVVASLIFLGSMNLAILRNNLTMAIVEMMANKTIVMGNQTIIQEPEFKWDSKTRGFLLSVFFYGHLATPLGGFLADRFGGVKIYGFSVLIIAISTFTTPINLRLNFYWYVFWRLIEGVSEGMALPAGEAIASKWVKPGIKSRFVSFGCTGYYVGATISFPLSGYLASRFGWSGIFYVTGLMAFFWSLIWLLVVSKDPAKDHESRSSFRQSANRKIAHPWKEILTSKSVWALYVAKISYGCGQSIVTFCVPIFLRGYQIHSRDSSTPEYTLHFTCNWNRYTRTRLRINVTCFFKDSFHELKSRFLFRIFEDIPSGRKLPRDMNFNADDSVHEYGPSRYETDSEIQSELERSRISKTYVVALLVCLGTINLSILRSNLTMAVVEMMSNKTIVVGNQTIIQEPEFKWDSKTRGFLLSAIYYGQLTFPLGGYLADKYGGVKIYGYGVLITAILTITTPVNLRLNFYWFIFCRMLEGVSESMSLPAIQAIASKWARPEEKSKFISFSYTGNYIGATISFPLCGYLAYRSDWTGIFYGTGLLALFWSLMWFIVVPADPPESHVSRSSSRLSVNSITASTHRQIAYPWKQILTSKSLWMLSVARISYGLGQNIVMICFPLFLKAMTNRSTEDISWLSTIPHATTIISMPLLGCLADYLINEKIFSTTRVHKLYLSGCISVAAGILALIGYVSELTIFVVCIVAFKILLTPGSLVVHVMPICIAPAYSSLMFGLTTLWHIICHIVSPLYMGFLVTNQSVNQWRIYFISNAIVMAIGSAVFAIYSSSEIQPWAVHEDEEPDEEESLNEDNQR